MEVRTLNIWSKVPQEKHTCVVYAIDVVWALFVWTLYMDFVCDLYIYFE